MVVTTEDRSVARYLCDPARVKSSSAGALRNMGSQLAIPFPDEEDVGDSCQLWLPKLDFELVVAETRQAAEVAAAEIAALRNEVMASGDFDTRETFKQLESWFLDQLRDFEKHLETRNFQKLQEVKSTLRTMKLHHLVRQQHEASKAKGAARERKRRSLSLPRWRK
jgi:hypothetical protein